MTQWKRLLAVMAILAMVAAACGSDDPADNASDDSAAVNTDDAPADEPDAPADEPDAPADEPDAPAETSAAGMSGDLLLLQWQAPSQANALLSNGTKDLLASSLVLEALAEFTPDGGLIPALAVEIPTSGNGIAEDGLSITWTLRDDVQWSDGTNFTSADVVFTYEYCIDEETGCSVEAFTTVESVVADGDYAITITFTEITPYPFSAFVGYTSPVIQAAQFANCVGAAAKSCSDENFGPIGTGPYMVTELRPEDTVTYAMNPNYRGIAEGKPAFATVTIKGGGDAESSARSVLEIGEADYAWNLQVAPEILASMEAAGQGRLASAFTANVEHINLNQTDPFADPPSEGTPNPLFVDNPDLHRALSVAINRDALVAVGYGPSGRATCNIWPVGNPSTTNDWCLTQDAAAANALLDGLGYLDTDGDGIREADGYGPLEFDYVTSTNAVRQSNQELIAQDWDAIGVKANMLNEDASLFFDGTCASDVCIWKFFTPMEMFTNGSSGPYGPGYLNGYESSKIPTAASSWGGDNIPRLNSAEFDALSALAGTTALDDPAFEGLVHEMNDIISSTALIPLIHRANASAFSTKIGNTGDLNGWDSEYYNIEDWTRSE
ncbi:MAG: peptide/nickel transport system substrate-binding protein [Verrucomicrobiales bacterium]|jgi:peptide/nickel transport system substrate-binding protein